MNAISLARIVASGLRRNRTRAVLTALSVAIGVALVVTVVAIGEGARRAVEKAAESMGTNVFLVWPSATAFGGVRTAAGSQATLTLDDARAIRTELPLVAHASGLIRLNASQCVNGNRNWNSSVHGVEESYLEVRSWPVAEGRMFTDMEVGQAARVCVLGERVADELFSIGPLVDDGAAAPRARENPVGVTIKIRGMPFRVIGVLMPKGQSAMGMDQDDVVLVPVTTALRRLGAMLSSAAPSAVDRVQVAAVDAASVEPAMDAVRELLARRHRSTGGPEEFTVRNFGDMARVAAEQQRIIALLLATVAAISLVVSGIGIMNIMLVSVTERTREIGLRLAVGAKREHILGQFLLEALAISGLGGLVGIGVAYLSSSAIQAQLEWAAPISAQAVAVAAGVSVAIGVFFGFYPARLASRLDPIDALRYE